MSRCPAGAHICSQPCAQHGRPLTKINLCVGLSGRYVCVGSKAVVGDSAADRKTLTGYAHGSYIQVGSASPRARAALQAQLAVSEKKVPPELSECCSAVEGRRSIRGGLAQNTALRPGPHSLKPPRLPTPPPRHVRGHGPLTHVNTHHTSHAHSHCAGVRRGP